MKKTILIGLVLAIILLSSCKDDALLKQLTEDKTDVKIEGAPGCGGKGGLTGCQGASYITDIKVEPAVDRMGGCLKVHANNCNGGMLGIENRCDNDLKLGGKIIPANSYKLIEFVRNKEREILVIEPEGNFDSYNPENEDVLTAEGTWLIIGEQDITISYTKKNVCGKAKVYMGKPTEGDAEIPDASGVSLKMEKTTFSDDETIKASVESEKTLLTGFPTFEVYQFFPWDSIVYEGDWIKVDIYEMEGAFHCGQVPESEICMGPPAGAQTQKHCIEYDPSNTLSEKFEWDQKIIKPQDIDCDDWTASCFNKENAGPGIYKLVFKYSENCVDEWKFEAEENNVQTIEKEFEIN